MMVWFIPRKIVCRQICLRVFSFGETRYSILLAGHAGKAWSDLVSENGIISSSRLRFTRMFAFWDWGKS